MVLSQWVVDALVSSLVAACVTITVSLLVHFCGGVVGGALGTVPHVAVVGSIGFSLQLSATSLSFQTAMLVMPIGMLNNSFYLAGLRVFSLHYGGGFGGKSSEMGRMLRAFFCSGTVFLVILALVVFFLKPETLPLATLQILAVASFFAEFLVGVLLIVYFPSAPSTEAETTGEDGGEKDDIRSKVWAFMGRGACTFVLFFVALALAQTLPALSGILVNLPIIGTVVVSSLWLSESKEVALSTLAPMVLGMLSASLYAILASFFMPGGVASGAIASWCMSVFCITCPVVYFLEKRRKARVPQNAVELEFSSHIKESTTVNV